jgi:hypothetical protein
MCAFIQSRGLEARPIRDEIIAFYRAAKGKAPVSVTGHAATAKMRVLVDVYVNVKAASLPCYRRPP